MNTKLIIPNCRGPYDEKTSIGSFHLSRSYLPLQREVNFTDKARDS